MNDVYNVPEKLKKEVVKYCYEEMNNIDKNKLKANGIRVNVFMELMYDFALHNLNDYNNYILDIDDMKNIYIYARNIELVMQDFFRGDRELIGIDNNDNLLFQNIKNIS